VRGHSVEPLVDESVFLGLGAIADERGYFGESNRAELAAALSHYASRAREQGAIRISFVGTEPLRRAADAHRVVDTAFRDARVPLHVITHEEEALLTLLGVTAGEPLTDELVVVDVGGGSSEFIVDAPPRAPVAAGIAVGSARLTAHCVAHDPPTREETEAMRRVAAAVVADAPDARPSEVVIVGGTATNLVRLVPAAMRDRTLTRRRIDRAVAALAAGPAAGVAAQHRLRVERARVLPAGAAVVGAILERYGVKRARVSDRGIREGLAIALAHAGRDWRDRLPGLVHGWTE
jgi:exopolyphosphatase/guanosine-5'-triphosphate,3'-diphosphate pyrophosphatase